MSRTFYRISDYGRDLVNNNYEVDFTLLGKALSISAFNPRKEGSLKPVEVISVLQQSGVSTIELAYTQGENFFVIGTVTGSDSQSIINYLDRDRQCIFIGRVNSRVDDIPYQQTFYVYEEGYKFADILEMVK